MTSSQMQTADEILSSLMESWDTAESKEIAAYVLGYFEGKEDAEEFAAENKQEPVAV